MNSIIQKSIHNVRFDRKGRWGFTECQRASATWERGYRLVTNLRQIWAMVIINVNFDAHFQ